MPMVLSERDGAVALLTLNNPAQYNALGARAAARLRRPRSNRPSPTPQVRVILLTGAGKGFCSGAQFGGDTFGQGEAIGALHAAVGQPADRAAAPVAQAGGHRGQRRRGRCRRGRGAGRRRGVRGAFGALHPQLCAAGCGARRRDLTVPAALHRRGAGARAGADRRSRCRRRPRPTGAWCGSAWTTSGCWTRRARWHGAWPKARRWRRR